MFSLSSERWHALKHYLLTASFVAGFIFDNLTLGRIDHLFGNLWLFGYLSLAGLSLFILYAAAADRVPERIRHTALEYTPFFVQFAFGGILSGVLVYYSRSGSWFTSWPFLIIIVGVIFANELVKDRVGRLIYNLVIFFVGAFAYFTIVIPVALKKMGPTIFVGSGLVSLVFFFVYLRILRIVIPRFIDHHMRVVVFTVGMVFAGMNFLYFEHLIPPVPLSIQALGIYHNVERHPDGTYALTYEKGPWYEFFKKSDTTFHYSIGDRVYCFAAVFAPTAFNTDIYHRWEYYDESTGEWVDHGRIPYAISGGADRGFRGFTYIDSVRTGKWRCTVETSRGEILGRDTVTVVAGEPPMGTTVTSN